MPQRDELFASQFCLTARKHVCESCLAARNYASTQLAMHRQSRLHDDQVRSRTCTIPQLDMVCARVQLGHVGLMAWLRNIVCRVPGDRLLTSSALLRTL